MSNEVPDCTGWDLVTSELCKGDDVGLNGNLFGGKLMSWVDLACAIFAKRVTKEKYIVTYRFSEMIFKSPVKVGEIVKIFAKLSSVGDHSITISVMVIDDDNSRIVLTTDCTFVAVDENTKKKKLDFGPMLRQRVEEQNIKSCLKLREERFQM